MFKLEDDSLAYWEVSLLKLLIAQQENLLVPNYGTGLCSSPDTGICCSVKSSSFCVEKLMPCKGILSPSQL